MRNSNLLTRREQTQQHNGRRKTGFVDENKRRLMREVAVRIGMRIAAAKFEQLSTATMNTAKSKVMQL